MRRQRVHRILGTPVSARCSSRFACPKMWSRICQPLIRAYIGEGSCIDLARLDEGSVPRLIASLKRKGVADSLIQQALAETDQLT